MLRATPQIETTRNCNNQKLYSKTESDQLYQLFNHALPKGKMLLTTRLLHIKTFYLTSCRLKGRLHSGSRDGRVGHEGSGAQFLREQLRARRWFCLEDACGPAAPVPAAVGRRAVGAGGEEGAVGTSAFSTASTRTARPLVQSCGEQRWHCGHRTPLPKHEKALRAAPMSAARPRKPTSSLSQRISRPK